MQRKSSGRRVRLKFVDDLDNVVCEADVVVAPVVSHVAKQSAQEANLEKAREKLNRYAGRAIEIITELAETSENDRVRLAAAESIADRAGLGKSATTQVVVNSAEHEAAKREAQELVARMAQNKGIPATTVHPDLDTLVVLEGEIA